MKYRAHYNTYHKGSYAKPGKLKSYHAISETIEARGIMHAARLADAHAKELTKTLGYQVQLADLSEVTK